MALELRLRELAIVDFGLGREDVVNYDTWIIALYQDTI
jgi:hypothetical protein